MKPVWRSGGSHASASCHQILNAGIARDSRSNRVSPIRKTTLDKSANDVTSAFGVAIRAYTDPGHVTHRKWAICAILTTLPPPLLPSTHSAIWLRQYQYLPARLPGPRSSGTRFS